MGFLCCGGGGGYSSLRCAGFSLRRLPWLRSTGSGLRSTGSGRTGFSTCSTWAQESHSIVVVHRLCYSQNVESSQTRDWTHVPCTGRRILYPLCHQRGPRLTLLSNPIHPSVSSNGPRRASTYKHKSFQPIPLCWFFTIEVFQSKTHSFIASLDYCLGLLMLGPKGTALIGFLGQKSLSCWIC